MFRFTAELQFSLLDPSLDQLVEGSDVGRFFDFEFGSDKLLFGNEANRHHCQSSIHGGGHLFELPQFCDGLIGPSVSDIRLVFRLHLLLGSLEGGDMRMELVIELLQRLMLIGGSFAVEVHLLSVTI